MQLVEVAFKTHILEVEPESQSIVVKDICENLGLQFQTQYRKLKSDPTYQSKLIKVQTAGGMQDVFTIPLSKLNGWLFSINPNKVKPEVKEKLIEYKNECFEVLYNHFNKSNHSQIPNSSLKELQETILKQNALIAATTNTINQEQSKHKHLAELYEKTLNENETLKQKMTQQLSLIVSQVSNEILTRFEESLNVTSRSLELQQQKRK